MTCKYFYCHCIYICVKNIVIFYVEFKTSNYFLSFHSPIFMSTLELFLRRDGQRGGGGVSKIRGFEWTYFLNDPKVFFAATKIHDMLMFNLTCFLISLKSKFWYQLLTMTFLKHYVKFLSSKQFISHPKWELSTKSWGEMRVVSTKSWENEK